MVYDRCNPGDAEKVAVYICDAKLVPSLSFTFPSISAAYINHQLGTMRHSNFVVKHPRSCSSKLQCMVHNEFWNRSCEAI